MKDTPWDHGLRVTAEDGGLVGHAGAVLLRKLADRAGLTAALGSAPARAGCRACVASVTTRSRFQPAVPASGASARRSSKAVRRRTTSRRKLMPSPQRAHTASVRTMP